MIMGLKGLLGQPNPMGPLKHVRWLGVPLLLLHGMGLSQTLLHGKGLLGLALLLQGLHAVIQALLQPLLVCRPPMLSVLCSRGHAHHALLLHSVLPGSNGGGWLNLRGMLVLHMGVV